MKTVGVVIPIYNVEKYLRECLDSVVNQTYKNLQVVLVNDGSTDENSLNIAKEYTLKDERFILFDKENGGQSTARNVGVEYFSGDFCFNIINEELQVDKHQLVEFSIKNNNSRAIRKIYKSSNYFANKKEAINFKNPNIDFIVFLDPDDYWTLDCIEECVKRSDNVDIVWFDYQMFYDNIEEKHYKHKTNLTKSQMQIYEYYKPEKITSMQWLERCLKIQADLPFWCVWGGIYSFAYLQKIKLKFLDGLIHEDVHFGMLLFAQAKHIYVFPKVLYYYRIRSASTASYDKITTKANIAPYIEHLCDVFDGDVKAAKEYHAKSSIFLNAWHIREFIAKEYDKEKGKLLEEAFFMFLYFWYFDFVELKHDPRRIKELFREHKPIYECNHKRYPEFDFFCKYGLVRYRIQKQLSYRIGYVLTRAKIYNFYLIPFRLILEFIKFKMEKNKKKLPKLDEYPDFNDVNRVKNHLSYLIGEALIKSIKQWYLGKPLILPFAWYAIYKKKKIKKSDYKKQVAHKPYFILPDHTLLNISKYKKAMQSSLSIYSKFNDASRAINTDIICDYAFCTSKDRWSWWMVDLLDTYFLEKIRILNVKNTFLRSSMRDIKIYVSIDNTQWTLIPQNFYIWKYNNFECDVVISNRVEARYIKILLERKVLSLSKVEVFKKRKKGYIISSKPDGLGMRIASILVGMYLAKKMNFEFGFLWHNSIDLAFMGITQSCKDEKLNYLGNCMDEVDIVFGESFIEQYFLPSEGLEYSHGNAIRKDRRTFEYLVDQENFEKEWGWYSTDILPNLWIEDCEESECLHEIQQIYTTINFSKQYQDILIKVQDDIAKLQAKFIALHIRGGDIIFSNIRKAPSFTPVIERLFPYEIALEIAIKELDKNNNIVVFGQDLNANKELVDYLKSFKQYNHLKILDISSFIDPNYTEMQRAFFEINFMSKAEKIYSAKESVFSKLAMMISGSNKLVSFHDIFSKDEQLKLIIQNMNKLSLHFLQKAMSSFRLFQLSRELNLPLENQIKYLDEALKLDNDNDGYRIYKMQCLFMQQDYNQINENIKIILENRYESFFQTLLSHSLGAFNDCYQDYINFNDEKYPYIFIVGFKISSFLGDLKRAQYLKLILLKNKNNTEKDLLLRYLTNDCFSAVGYVKSDIRYQLGNALIKMEIIKTFQILYREKKQNKLLREHPIGNLDLKSCSDYYESLECKKHLSYQLGDLILKAHQNRYKGAYFILPYKIYMLYKNFKYKKGK
ncbi:glycosyltransferase [Campylobacter jejuni]|nr:glycosyltransferase [Campylobacter jejuni]EAK5742649.1 glycosyltransferase [Campylobacter jejuni]